MRLEGELNSFDVGKFKNRICNIFDDRCNPSDIIELTTSAGSIVVNFTINFVHGGPTIPHMRECLVDADRVQAELGTDFTLSRPYTIKLFERTNHRSNDDLRLKLLALKTVGAVNAIFVLVGAWGIVVFWSITSRGQACRAQAHSEFRSRFIPSGETLQVFVLSGFVQLLVSLALHMSSTGTFYLVYLYGLITAIVGAAFTGIFNAWIRGESVSLRAALSVEKIDRNGRGGAGLHRSRGRTADTLLQGGLGGPAG